MMLLMAFALLFVANYTGDAVSKRAVEKRFGSRIIAYFGVLALSIPVILDLAKNDTSIDLVEQGVSVAVGLLCLLYAFRK